MEAAGRRDNGRSRRERKTGDGFQPIRQCIRYLDVARRSDKRHLGPLVRGPIANRCQNWARVNDGVATGWICESNARSRAAAYVHRIGAVATGYRHSATGAWIDDEVVVTGPAVESV